MKRAAAANVLAVGVLALPASGEPLMTTFAGGVNAAGAMFDVTPLVAGVEIRSFALNINLPVGTSFQFRIWTRPGTYEGHTNSPAGWSFHSSTQVLSRGPGSPTWIHCYPPAALTFNQPTGVFIEISNPASTYMLCTPIPPAQASYANETFIISGGVAKGTGGFAGMDIPNTMWNGWVSDEYICYPNCDHSVPAPFLNVMDYQCFLTAFAAGFSYTNCDGSSVPPILSVNDFSCFLQKYAAGCSMP